jgi:5-formyltetrahydrofolate cyclo-ligase
VTPFDVDQAKLRVREQALSARAGFDPALGEALAGHVLAACPPPPGAVVAGFWPIRDEIDVRPLLAALHARGHPIALPVTGPRGTPLSFRQWTPGDPLEAGRFGTVHPTGPLLTPAFLLVPLLAFDRAGGRIGYGAGYYDRTLSVLPDAFALGCAYAAQEVASVPMGPYDVRLEAVATERGVIFCKGG